MEWTEQGRKDSQDESELSGVCAVIVLSVRKSRTSPVCLVI